MKLFNWESRQKQAAKDKKEIIPIHEESGGIIKDREGLSREQQEQAIIKKHLDIDDEEYRLTKNDPEKLTSLEDIPDDVDWQDYMSKLIDWEETEDNELYSDDEELAKLEKIEEQKDFGYDDEPQISSAKPQRPKEVSQIINKYSKPSYEWNKLSQSERKEIKNKIQTEIQELYIKQPKKMKRKKEENSVEKAA